MHDNGDILLFVLSAWGSTPWRTFRRCVDEIHRRTLTTSSEQSEDHATGSRWRAIRELSALAHIDLHLGFDQPHIFVSPPTLAVLPGHRRPRAILCGARSPALVKRLEDAARQLSAEITVESQATTSPYAPSRIVFSVEHADLFRPIAETTNLRLVVTPPARMLARASISLDVYRRELEWSDQDEINWPKQDFNAHDLLFHPREGSSNESRLTRYQNPSTSMWEYRLWQANRSAHITLDWGRYAALAFSSRKVLHYDPNARTVSVPHRAQLPALIARAFGMCTGYCPRQIPAPSLSADGPRHEFTTIPPSLFNAVAPKLAQ